MVCERCGAVSPQICMCTEISCDSFRVGRESRHLRSMLEHSRRERGADGRPRRGVPQRDMAASCQGVGSKSKSHG